MGSIPPKNQDQKVKISRVNLKSFGQERKEIYGAQEVNLKEQAICSAFTSWHTNF